MAGQWIEGYGLQNLITSYYSDIFTSKGVQVNDQLEGVAQRISTIDNLAIMVTFTLDDVK